MIVKKQALTKSIVNYLCNNLITHKGELICGQCKLPNVIHILKLNNNISFRLLCFVCSQFLLLLLVFFWPCTQQIGAVSVVVVVVVFIVV